MQVNSTKLLHIPDIESVPTRLEMPTPHFKCLFICDAQQVEVNKVDQAMNNLLNQGMVYLCAWGPACEQVHDAADAIVVRNEFEKGAHGTIMTTWHEKESLEEAWWFFENCAFPDEYFVPTYGSGIIIVINNPKWQQKIAALIAQNSA